MFMERFRARTAALVIALLLPAGLAACSTAGKDGPFLREDIPWNSQYSQYEEPAASPFLNDALFGDPRNEFLLDRYEFLEGATYFPNGIGGAGRQFRRPAR